ncbi:MAG: hypothetical protein ABI772_09415, partial [Bacteroidota bacterium]
WKPELIGNYLESNTPFIHPDKYEIQTGVRINYILQWKWNEGMQDSSTVSVNQLLDSLYTPVFSSPTGNAKLWKRNIEHRIK